MFVELLAINLIYHLFNKSSVPTVLLSVCIEVGLATSLTINLTSFQKILAIPLIYNLLDKNLVGTVHFCVCVMWRGKQPH